MFFIKMEILFKFNSFLWKSDLIGSERVFTLMIYL